MLTDLLAALVNPAPRYRHQVGDDVLSQYWALTAGEQMKIINDGLRDVPVEQWPAMMKALGVSHEVPFITVPGPQQRARESLADELLYGGAAGGGKSILGLGCAVMDHRRSLVLRRQSTELEGLTAELIKMLGRGGWHAIGNGGEWRDETRSIRLGGMQDADDWRGYAGTPRDLMYFDEAGEFLELQVASLLGWLRTTEKGQRCRVIFGSNPPRGSDGQWMIEWFAPWLDPSYPGPAKSGELRWFVNVKSKTRWVDGPGRHDVDGETYIARSRTFIAARLVDNPYLTQDDQYLANLMNRPEPLRSQLLKGDFLAGREDDAWQVIPSDWIQKARLRWTPEGPSNVPMTALGVDVAQGGPDRTVLAARKGRWYAPLKAVEGIDTSSGPAVAGLVFQAMRDGCTIVVDMGGGWGGSAYDHLRHQLPSDSVVGFVGASGSTEKTSNGLEGFANKRAEAWWRFREALDPETGADIALPPDTELAAELGMPRRIPEKREIQIEMKKDIIKRLGRSPDKADAVVMAWSAGTERAARRHENLPTQANVGYASAKRRTILGRQHASSRR